MNWDLVHPRLSSSIGQHAITVLWCHTGPMLQVSNNKEPTKAFLILRYKVDIFNAVLQMACIEN